MVVPTALTLVLLLVVVIGGVGTLAAAALWLPRVAERGLDHTGIGHFWRCNSGNPGMPAWSPNGREIAYGKPTACGTKIAIVNLQSGKTRLVTKGFSDGLPDWPPDGQSLLYQDGADERRVNLATGTNTIVIHNIEEFGARFSPGGRFIAYTHGFMGSPFDGGDSTTSVYVKSVRTGRAWRVFGHDVNGGTPTWSSDGSHLAVEGFNGLYLVERSGGNPRRVLPLSVSTPGTPAWSVNGEIAFVEDGEIAKYGLITGKITVLANCSCGPQEDGVSWSPDGLRLAYSTQYGVFVISSTGTNKRQLAAYDTGGP